MQHQSITALLPYETVLTQIWGLLLHGVNTVIQKDESTVDFLQHWRCSFLRDRSEAGETYVDCAQEIQ